MAPPAGQELNNTAEGNAVGCPRVLECRCKRCVSAHQDSDFNEQAGMYTLSGERANGLPKGWRTGEEGGEEEEAGRRTGVLVEKCSQCLGVDFGSEDQLHRQPRLR